MAPRTPRVAVVDFETEGILRRPAYPPIPVGVSIKKPTDKKSKYYAWGHPCENNCTWEDARKALLEVWEDSSIGIAFHNAKFDVDVAETHMKLPRLPWERLHDTMFLLFLKDPHQKSMALKPAGERLLGLPPEERDEVKDWILANLPPRQHGYKPSEWGKFICKAPGKLVGTYADGDVLRTDKLFKLVWPEIQDRGMGPAYDRERKLLPILLDNERAGVNVDLPLLEADHTKYLVAKDKADDWLRKRFKEPDMNIDSDAELAEVLDREGLVTEWVMTKTGKKSTAKKNMPLDKISDPKVAKVLGYRGRLSTCISTFMAPWLEMARESNGIIYTNWNQVKQTSSGGDNAGARTGRMSSNPNFMNIPKSFYDKNDGYEHPKFLKSLPELPLMRYYILPDKGQYFAHRDYNQQELRILAHFEDGPLMQAYLQDPRLDIHTMVQTLIHEITGHLWPRSPVKIVNFGKVYGMGVSKLAESIKDTIDAAKRLSDAHKKALPGVAVLEKTIKANSKAGDCITTWGGREYYVEDPIILPNGHKQTFEYKLLNYLIQGSAADCTKEAIIRYHERRKDGRFLLTVHDEINLSVPKKALDSEMKILREAMLSVEFDVPMLSDGKFGERWGDTKKYEEKH